MKNCVSITWPLPRFAAHGCLVMVNSPGRFPIWSPGGHVRIARWVHPPELERQREQSRFDPVAEGARHGLSSELSLAIWERARADATDGMARLDADQAQRRFHDVAARIQTRGGRLAPEVGRLTRVQTEIVGVAPDAWADVAKPSVPGRQPLAGHMSNPRIGLEDYRVLGLRDVLQWLRPDHPLLGELVAAAAIADRSIAGRATLWHAPLPNATGPKGRAQWQAAERRAATLYRRAVESGRRRSHATGRERHGGQAAQGRQ